ncbi:hypothetical protein B0T09DRAFT_97043 [Sordaria sp. MPI-SDFR-AT-0083]|nr:hypothetical protein B0T09DRAFT_97043 [Sordaria sp. MPI-SDFR-AT-0083]
MFSSFIQSPIHGLSSLVWSWSAVWGVGDGGGEMIFKHFFPEFHFLKKRTMERKRKSGHSITTAAGCNTDKKERNSGMYTTRKEEPTTQQRIQRRN